MLDIEVSKQVETEASELPTSEQVDDWVGATLAGRDGHFELTVRIVSDEEIRALNRRFRHQDKVTNVLSFPVGVAECPELLGDVVIGSEVVAREAARQQKPVISHYAHMVVHGVLHLLGYNHVESSAADDMERRETVILRGLGFSDPYRDFRDVQ